MQEHNEVRKERDFEECIESTLLPRGDDELLRAEVHRESHLILPFSCAASASPLLDPHTTRPFDTRFPDRIRRTSKENFVSVSSLTANGIVHLSLSNVATTTAFLACALAFGSFLSYDAATID
jgi:hypothetical protein